MNRLERQQLQINHISQQLQDHTHERKEQNEEKDERKGKAMELEEMLHRQQLEIYHISQQLQDQKQQAKEKEEKEKELLATPEREQRQIDEIIQQLNEEKQLLLKGLKEQQGQIDNIVQQLQEMKKQQQEGHYQIKRIYKKMRNEQERMQKINKQVRADRTGTKSTTSSDPNRSALGY